MKARKIYDGPMKYGEIKMRDGSSIMENCARAWGIFLTPFSLTLRILSLVARGQIEINDAASLWKATTGYHRVRRRVMANILSPVASRTFDKMFPWESLFSLSENSATLTASLGDREPLRDLSCAYTIT